MAAPNFATRPARQARSGKAPIDRETLRQHRGEVKIGLPAVAYLRLDPAPTWPEHLQVKLPQ